MSEIELFPSDDESLYSQTPNPAIPRSSHTSSGAVAESPTSFRGRQPIRSTLHSPRRLGQPSPPPVRHTPSSSLSSSSSSSYSMAQPTIPGIEKWTVLGLRQALISADVHFSRRFNKSELYKLYSNLQSPCAPFKPPSPSKKTTTSSKGKKTRTSQTQSSSTARPVQRRYNIQPSSVFYSASFCGFFQHHPPYGITRLYQRLSSPYREAASASGAGSTCTAHCLEFSSTFVACGS
ncbi:hypothetical protein DPX16_11427 [Anabarilius grahami]|uniref:Uncharacterized protein n=1 Tax=Anabarilius grahami TaxID=495550 RepID=A0A3N0Y463_ANAGA|nr:hypothetical protein DPX16_11427 [Anabarilius grahami]